MIMGTAIQGASSMRALVYYVLAVLGGAVYGGQV